MKQTKIETIEELISSLNCFESHYVFRGHASASWNLESTLERVVGNEWSSDSAKKFEDLALARFKSKFHLYDRENISPSSLLSWLSIMQHYGVPTRLLDFTESPYVALYFALEGYKYESCEDMAIFALNHRSLMNSSLAFLNAIDGEFNETPNSVHSQSDSVFEKTVNRFSYKIAWITEPNFVNARLDRQSGCFLLAGDRNLRIMDILSQEIYADLDFQKLIIKGSLGHQIYALLRKMNMTSKNIYGDLQGLGASIRMEMQAYSTLQDSV